MSHNKRSNQYSVINDIAISIKFDMEELEELIEFRDIVASDKTLGRFFYQLMVEVKATDKSGTSLSETSFTEKLTEKRYLVG